MGNFQAPRVEAGNAATHDLRLTPAADLICLSHLRWDALDARSKFLLSRWAKEGRRVYFIEAPSFDGGMVACLDLFRRGDHVRVAVPHLPFSFAGRADVGVAMQGLLDDLFATEGIREHALWYFTPTALAWTEHLKPLATIYDCVGEPSTGGDDAIERRELEAGLFARADLVFAGEAGACEEKREQYPQHKGIYAVPPATDASLEQAWARMSQLVERLVDARRDPARNAPSPGEKERSLAAAASTA